MPDIYSKAAGVTIWLGPAPDGDAEIVFRNIKGLVESLLVVDHLDGQFEAWNSESLDLIWRTYDGKVMSSDLYDFAPELLDPSEEDVERFSRFFQNPWFSRTWVLQEAGLATEANVVWGGMAMNWNVVGVAAMFLHRHAKALLRETRLFEAVENICTIYLTFSPFTPLNTFLHHMNNVRKLKATDPRDKVFALLSHPTASTISMTPSLPVNAHAFKQFKSLMIRLIPNTSEKYLIKQMFEDYDKGKAPKRPIREPLIPADYGKEMSEVYRDVVTDHIARTESLEILASVQHDPNALELPEPSWVPRWDQDIKTPVLGFISCDHIAAANRSAIVTPSPNIGVNELIVRGTVISRIGYASGLLHASSFDFPPPSRPAANSSNAIGSVWVKSGLAATHEQGAEYPQLPLLVAPDGTWYVQKAISYWRAYLETWTAGKRDDTGLSGFDDDDAFEYWRRLFSPKEVLMGSVSALLDRLALKNDGDDDKEGKKEQTHKVSPQENLARATRYKQAVSSVATRRKFFITKKGFLGLGPGALKEGDWVAVLLGLDVPVVLREVGGDKRPPGPFPEDVKFQLVGECYVQGLMQGQGVKGSEVKRDIVLL